MKFQATRARVGLVVVSMGSLMAPSAFAAPILPTYTTIQTDVTWTLGPNNYTVPSSSENYSLELWERNIEDGKWFEAGGVMTLATDGLYRGYGDLSGAGYGVGTGGDPTGAQYVFAYWDVVEPCEDKVSDGPGKDCGVGLKGHYYFYFELAGVDPFLIEIPSGTALSANYTTGQAKAYREPAGNVYGTSITTPCESTNCTDPAGSLPMTGYNSEIGNPNQIFARTPSSTRVEVAVPLSLLGVSAASFDDLLWAYSGVATSNPSGTNDVFVNDQFRFQPGKGVEYDTLRFQQPQVQTVPEPATLLLLGTGVVAAGFRRYRRHT